MHGQTDPIVMILTLYRILDQNKQGFQHAIVQEISNYYWIYVVHILRLRASKQYENTYLGDPLELIVATCREKEVKLAINIVGNKTKIVIIF